MRDSRPRGSRKALPSKRGWGAEEARPGCLVSGNDFIPTPIVPRKQFLFTNRPAIVLLVPEEICGWAGLHNCRCGPCQSPWLREASAAGRAQHSTWALIYLSEAAWTQPPSPRLALFCCSIWGLIHAEIHPPYLLPHPVASVQGSLASVVCGRATAIEVLHGAQARRGQAGLHHPFIIFQAWLHVGNVNTKPEGFVG